jgi:hypothetical protein
MPYCSRTSQWRRRSFVELLGIGESTYYLIELVLTRLRDLLRTWSSSVRHPTWLDSRGLMLCCQAHQQILDRIMSLRLHAWVGQECCNHSMNFYRWKNQGYSKDLSKLCFPRSCCSVTELPFRYGGSWPTHRSISMCSRYLLSLLAECSSRQRSWYSNCHSSSKCSSFAPANWSGRWSRQASSKLGLARIEREAQRWLRERPKQLQLILWH